MAAPFVRSFPATESIHIDFVHYEAYGPNGAFRQVRLALDRLEACRKPKVTRPGS